MNLVISIWLMLFDVIMLVMMFVVMLMVCVLK